MNLLDKLGLGHGLFIKRPFLNIEGYSAVKDIIERALDSEDNYNLLFIGRPASAKTLFLLGILEMRKDGVYFDGSNTTSRILDVLEEERPRFYPLSYRSHMSSARSSARVSYSA
jgi:Holliday junction DNA helicase RuvB